jgi:hypothetical protein
MGEPLPPPGTTPDSLPALEVKQIEPVRLEMRGGVCFADFGTAAYGNLQVVFPSHQSVTKLIVRLGEKLDGNGVIDRKPPGSVNYREIGLDTREGQSIYKLDIPSKPFHQRAAAVKMPSSIGEVTPFRYVEIEGSPVALDKSSLRQLAVQAAI